MITSQILVIDIRPCQSLPWFPPREVFTVSINERVQFPHQNKAIAMKQDAPTNDIGSATMEPAGEVIAGSHGTWRLTFMAGNRGVEVGGRIRVHTDSDTDWAIPQFIDCGAADYMSIESPDGVQTSVVATGPRALWLTIRGRKLQSGEEVALIYGDTTGGGPGSRTQTFADERRYFRVGVDSNGSGHATDIDDPPYVSIIGGDAVRLVVIAPSDVAVGEAFRVLVKAEDAWGNPSWNHKGAVTLSGDGIRTPTENIAFDPANHGAIWIEGFEAGNTGLFRLTAIDQDNGLTALSNPIESRETNNEFRLHWADPHGGQLVLNSKFAEFYRYARDVAGIQFVGFQRNADCISFEDWEVQQREEVAFHEPGRFIPIPGFEWSGRVWDGGHHNIYFRRHDQPVRRNPPAEVIGSVDPSTELPHIRDVYHHYRNTDTIITAHVGGEHSNLAWHEPTLEPGVEITSSHGSFEWMLRDALRRGYKLGFLGGSDSYTSRPGDDRPGHQLRRYSKAGLTGIYCNDVSLDSFFEAMRARRFFATTGTRMILNVKSGDHYMGEEFTTSELPTVNAEVRGTNSLESVELYRGLQCIYSHPIPMRQCANRVRILWKGSSRKTSYSGIIWDGTLNVTDGKILAAETVRFDSPRSHIVEQSESSVTWHAWGCGYTMGLILDLEATDETSLQIAVGNQAITSPMYGEHGSVTPPRRISFAPADRFAFHVRVGDLAEGPQELPLGVLDRNITASLANEPSPNLANFQFTDESPEPGINPYWIRVVQSDMEIGWSSPLFVDYSP